jgi:hypothetical protein
MEKTFHEELVLEWHKRLSEGREEDERSNCSVMVKTDENVSSLVRKDRRLDIRMRAGELNMDK